MCLHYYLGLKETVHPKIKFYSSFTIPRVIIYTIEHKCWIMVAIDIHSKKKQILFCLSKVTQNMIRTS